VRRSAFCAVLAVVFCLAFLPVPTGTTGQSDLAYELRFNIYRVVFTEPFESVLFLFRDGTIFIYTTHEENIISIPSGVLLQRFQELKRDPKDILLVVHNHLDPGRFSALDIAFYYRLRGYGFNGVFGIYYPASNHFVELKER